MLQIYDNIKMKEILDIMGNSLFTSVHLGNRKTFELANQGEIGGRGCPTITDGLSKILCTSKRSQYCHAPTQ